MKGCRAIIIFVMLGGLFTVPGQALAAAQAGYFQNIGPTFLRGVKNVLTFPADIPRTIQEYHCGEGRAFVRHMAGFTDGTFRMVARAGSGAWDLIAAFAPGMQEGLPVSPETLF